MIPRIKSREVALQVLFQKAFSPESSAIELFNAFRDSFELDRKVVDRTLQLVAGVEEFESQILEIVESTNSRWRLDRMATTDKIILQLGVFEIYFEKNPVTPPKMCISDYVDVAKKYSSENSKGFINGILDEIYQRTISTEVD